MNSIYATLLTSLREPDRAAIQAADPDQPLTEFDFLAIRRRLLEILRDELDRAIADTEAAEEIYRIAYERGCVAGCATTQ